MLKSRESLENDYDEGARQATGDPDQYRKNFFKRLLIENMNTSNKNHGYATHRFSDEIYFDD